MTDWRWSYLVALPHTKTIGSFVILAVVSRVDGTILGFIHGVYGGPR